jgi:hypothetical protein
MRRLIRLQSRSSAVLLGETLRHTLDRIGGTCNGWMYATENGPNGVDAGTEFAYRGAS